MFAGGGSCSSFSASGTFSGLTSDTVLLWLSNCGQVVRVARDCIAGRSAKVWQWKRPHQTSGVRKGLRDVSAWGELRALHQAGRRIALSLPVGADKSVLRRPVRAIVR